MKYVERDWLRLSRRNSIPLLLLTIVNIIFFINMVATKSRKYFIIFNVVTFLLLCVYVSIRVSLYLNQELKQFQGNKTQAYRQLFRKWLQQLKNRLDFGWLFSINVMLQIYMIVFLTEMVSRILSPLAMFLIISDFEWLAHFLGYQSKKELWLDIRSKIRNTIKRVIDILPRYS